jgi:hypothetical protein
VRSALVTWLWAQAGLLLLGVATFGLAFPALGLAIGATGMAPPGEDPLAIAVTLGVAGPCTAGIYAVPAGLCVVAARRSARDPAGSLLWVVAASAASGFVCLLGVLPLVLWALEAGRSPVATDGRTR